MARPILIFLSLFLLAGAVPAQERDWGSVRSFAYQLQEANLAILAGSRFDLLILDYSADGSDQHRYTPQQIRALRRGPEGRRRLVLCYLSVGEAENYRFYWKKAFRPGVPAWLDRVNPEWEGNFKVHYWDPAWQGLVTEYLDRVLAAGFDGVYLDAVDSYEYYEGRGHSEARAQMKALVKKVALYARKRAGSDFGIFPQNGDDLLQDKDYLRCITGIGREDTYYGEKGDNRSSDAIFTRHVEANLDLAIKAGKLVLNTDYTNVPAQVAVARKRASARGYLEYAAPRRLNELRSP